MAGRNSSSARNVSITEKDNNDQSTSEGDNQLNSSPPDARNEHRNLSLSYVHKTGWRVKGLNSQLAPAEERRRSRALEIADPLRLTVKPEIILCPKCGHIGLSRVKRKITPKTHLCAALFCLSGCLFCAICPYVFSTFKDHYHYCLRCRTLIGVCEE